MIIVVEAAVRIVALRAGCRRHRAACRLYACGGLRAPPKERYKTRVVNDNDRCRLVCWPLARLNAQRLVFVQQAAVFENFIVLINSEITRRAHNAADSRYDRRSC